MTDRKLILGIDGGGSKTAVRIATVGGGTVGGGLPATHAASREQAPSHSIPSHQIITLGEGFGGPSNVRAIGPAHAEINLDVAVDAAHRDAGTTGETIDYAVLALAGSSLPDVKAVIENWAKRRRLAEQVDVVHDADPVLAAGTPGGDGIALIVGTGSVAIGMDSEGHRSMAGGWGHWFGDTGSGFDLGRRALAAVADAVDGIGNETALVEHILERLHTDNPREILLRLGQQADIRREIATLAPVLLHTAEDGDEVAADIVAQAASSTAALVHATVKKLGFDHDVPLAIAGGIVCSNTMYRETLLEHLRALGTKPASVSVVRDPVEGSLIMARDRLLGAGELA